ncbi:MAG: LysM peptidoglycan-binding domain-containing protein [Anaerolineae bacterium]|nr:LysM peptidoglycan-binding domain-containing protein [Anaerolineae bacterium]
MRRIIFCLAAIAMLLGVLSNRAYAETPDYYVTVKMGDTLFAIAARYGVSVNALMETNDLPNANFVYIGQRLVIPGLARSDGDTQTTTAGNSEYIVRAGDTLFAIAVKHNSTVDSFVRANNLASTNVYTGQRLRVPGATPSEKTARLINPTARPEKFSYNDPNGAPAPLGGVVPDPPTLDKWIDIDVTAQTVTAYEGSTPIKSVVVSTGVTRTPTVLGTYKIYRKIPSQTMSGGSQAAGDYYYLPNVTDVMYFYQGYAFHGTYWHNNFGRPMSHGCVNMTLADAKWFYQWASVGTMVVSRK